jgi:hypothetical protein
MKGMMAKEGIIRWFHKKRKDLLTKNSINFGSLCNSEFRVTPDDGIVCRNILSSL